MSIYKGTTLISGIATNTITNGHNLLDFKWTDHELNDQSWLKSNAFSWHDGTVYSNAYSHLVADYSGGTSKTETIGSYTITFVEAADGHRITADESTVADIYNESGVAWYYILDTANQRFKLPRTKYGFTGLRDAVGKYVPESLPNIKGSTTFGGGSGRYAIQNSAVQSGAFTKYNAGIASNSWAGTASDGRELGFDASLSSSTYQNNAPVQQRATQMYLYFYVGEFSQSATEQTAGLNSSLFNGKADVDLSNAASNASSSAKSIIVGWGLPNYSSSVTISSGYVATENGYVIVSLNGQDHSNNSIYVNGILVASALASNAYQEAPINFQAPVSTGDVVTWSTGSGMVTVARFVPMKG